ncbi:hypothetical protein Q8F55_001145 [Vanrija albida]|uniref:Uncharacterized protein n=1 Tax=Vanrija albida TaxID=181172 RepID=A0ABR3QF87_9TREE
MGAPTDFPTPAAAPAARSKKHDEDDEGEHHPVSIASLRSKFETMAHGVHSVAHNAHHSLRPVRPASPVVAASNDAFSHVVVTSHSERCNSDFTPPSVV